MYEAGAARARGALFGCPTVLEAREARRLRDGLQFLRDRQFRAVEAPAPRKDSDALADQALRTGEDLGVAADALTRVVDLLADLNHCRAWFDPTAKGEKVRSAVAAVEPAAVELPFSAELTVAGATSGARLVTPEALIVLFCLESGLSGSVNQSTHRIVRLPEPEAALGVEVLLDVYRSWSRRRYEDVVGLLTSEPSTLRPAAAGLLLFLLINGNTSHDRALRRPKDPRDLELVSRTVHTVAATYAAALAGKPASERATDLYRGWALGELRRRFGPSLHTSFDEGIWLDPAAVPDAIERLGDDLARRRDRARSDVVAGLDAAFAEYAASRRALAGLGLAFERASATSSLRSSLIGALGRPDGDAP